VGKLKVRARLAIVMATALTVAAVAGGVATPTKATAAPPVATGSGGIAPDHGKSAGPTSGAEPVAYKNFLLKGGYVSAGVGLRNRGAGNISLGGIPSGAKVKAAYLYWSVLGATAEPLSYRKGSFAGTGITGTKVGSGASACWPSTTTGYAYRAEVTTKVKGNGNYSLAGFASGVRDGRDPFATAEVPPLTEGASLVVVFEKSTYPETRVVIKNGYTMVQSAPGASTWMSFGFSASNPVGAVKTTFIGGDGQSNATEPPSLVNGIPIAAADWDGTDGPLPRYSAGNLWDTDTVNLVNVVKPGHTGATVRVQGGSDCLAWVAQVLSIGRNGNLDTDGDKLKDGWEANGYDANNDGIVDVNLPAMGASVVHKDLFVEMDYMGAQTTCPCYLPQTADLNRIVAVFAGAPQAKQPRRQGRHPAAPGRRCSPWGGLQPGRRQPGPLRRRPEPGRGPVRRDQGQELLPPARQDLLLHDLGARLRRWFEQR